MISITEAVRRLGGTPDQATLEVYIDRAWISPVKSEQGWHFEEIDIARIGLVHQLRHDMSVNDEAMDVVLHLLDQVYGLRERIRMLSHCIGRQPASVQTELYSLLRQMDEEYTDA